MIASDKQHLEWLPQLPAGRNPEGIVIQNEKG